MSPAEQAILSALSAEAKAAIKALLKDFADNEVPAIEAAEAEKLPLVYQPFVGAAFKSIYPPVQKALDDKIAAL